MKRLFAVLLVAALVMGGAFAQLSFNVQVASELWGTNGFKFAPNMQGTAGTADDWGMTDSATLFNLDYSTDKAGVSVDIRPVYNAKDGLNANWGNAGNGLMVHQYSGWFKPIDMLKISMGTNVAVSVFGADEMRWNCLGARAGEVCGIAAELTPIDGLYIGYVLEQCGEDIDKTKMGAAASYNIGGVGNFGVQWTTGDYSFDLDGDNGPLPKIESGKGIDGKIMALGVGADLAIVDGLRIKPVYTIALDNNDNGLDPMHKIDLFLAWGNGPFSIKLLERALVRTYDMEGDDKYSNFGNIVKAEVNYAVTDAVSVNLKAAWGMNVGKGDTGNGDWSGIAYWDPTKCLKGNNMSVYLSVPVAFDAGVTVVPGFLLKFDSEAEDDKATWSIPLALKYSF